MAARQKQFYPYLIMAAIIVCGCFELFYLDKDTHYVADLFKPGNIAALIIYFIPTFLLCFFLYRIFVARNYRNSLVWAMIIGLPAGLMIVMILLGFWMNRV